MRRGPVLCQRRHGLYDSLFAACNLCSACSHSQISKTSNMRTKHLRPSAILALLLLLIPTVVRASCVHGSCVSDNAPRTCRAAPTSPTGRVRQKRGNGQCYYLTGSSLSSSRLFPARPSLTFVLPAGVYALNWIEEFITGPVADAICESSQKFQCSTAPFDRLWMLEYLAVCAAHHCLFLF